MYIMKCRFSIFQKGDNAIHLAARTGRLGVIKRLKRKGDDLEKRNIVSYHIVITHLNLEDHNSINVLKTNLDYLGA